MRKDAVITGVGCITSLGDNISDIFNLIKLGKVGIEKIKQDDESYMGATIDKIDLRKYKIKGKNMMLRYNKLEIFSVASAINEYNWLNNTEDENSKCSVYLGNQIINFDYETLEIMQSICCDDETKKIDFNKLGERLKEMPPLSGVKLLPTASSHFISKNCGLHGGGNLVYGGDSTSLATILCAAKDIENGVIDRAIVASTYSKFSPHESRWLRSLEISCKGEKCVDEVNMIANKENKVIYGEGAGAILIESEESAKKHNHKILARVLGGSINNFAGETIYTLNKESFVKNMTSSLLKANVQKEDIDAIYSNMQFYYKWDMEEFKAIKELWSEEEVCVTSSKGKIGYLGCASGIIDCIFAVKSISDNEYLPMINTAGLSKKDGRYFEIKNKTINKCLISSAGLGGNYCSLIIEKE